MPFPKNAKHVPVRGRSLVSRRKPRPLGPGRVRPLWTGTLENTAAARPSPARGFKGRGLRSGFGLCLVFLWLAACAAPEAPVYRDKRNLLHYLDRQGKAHPIEGRNHWAIRRTHILQNMQKVMGPLPQLPDDPLEVQVLETERLPQIRRRKITFVSQVVEGKPDRVPAYLLIPNALPEGQSAPAVLCLHQTTSIGKAEPAGLGGIGDLHYAWNWPGAATSPWRRTTRGSGITRSIPTPWATPAPP